MLYLRALELPDGRWLCKQGRARLDVHDTLDAALAHLRAFGQTLGEDVEIRVHELPHKAFVQ